MTSFIQKRSILRRHYYRSHVLVFHYFNFFAPDVFTKDLPAFVSVLENSQTPYIAISYQRYRVTLTLNPLSFQERENCIGNKVGAFEGV